MSTVATPILGRTDPVGGHPAITYRQAGDRSVLVEYGDMELDLTLNFFVLAVDAALRDHTADGVLENAPGFRSMLVRYDPKVLRPGELIAHLSEVHDSLPAEQEIEIPSRVLELPIAFDDSQSRAAVERYIRSIRKDAPNCEGANNIDYIVRYNGFADREEFYEAVLATEHWTGFIGFFPGLPFMFPVDPRHTVVAPKYNPTRTWTAEGAVGLGGPCYAIYPVESAGGYQLFGRSLPVYDLRARNEIFRENPLLLRPGDRVTFHRTSEDELMSMFEDVRADRYRYQIEERPFDVGAYLDLRAKVWDEAEERRRHREEASAAAEVP